MKKTVLLTIGRLPKALDFARSFHKAGWRVLVAEPHKSHLTGVSNCVARSFVVPAPRDGKEAYLAALAKVVFAEQVDLVLPLSEETMHVAFLRPLLPDSVCVYAPRPDKLMALHNKADFIDLARGYNLPVPLTTLLDSSEARALAMAQDYIVKPVFSCSGRGVSLHKAGEALPHASHQDRHERLIVQEKLTGDPYSTFAIAHDGQILIDVTYRGTIMSGSVAVAFERVEVAAITTWVKTFVEAIGHSGFISFDFFVSDDGIARAIECNPRVTSGVHFIETADLASAIVSPNTDKIRLKSLTKMMQFFPSLTELQGNFFTSSSRANLAHMRQSKDVTWDAKDPLPFVTMPLTAFTIIAKSMREQKTFGEVSTADISWFE